MDYILHILIMINIYIILGLSSNLLVGMANLISLGQAAFYGVGAYITAMCLVHLHLSLLPTMLIGMAANIALCLLIALPSLRLRGDYFILCTMGFQLIVYSILYNWVEVTNGPYGISGIPSPNLIGGLSISGAWGFFILSGILASILGFVMFRMIHSPFGRALRAMREDEIALSSLGRNVFYFKIWAFVIASAFMAWAGMIYASYVSYIDPTSFTLDEAIFILSAVVIGGTGNVKGPIAGAVFVILLPELLRFVGLPDSISAPMKQILYGMCLILMMRYRPWGIAGSFKFE